VKNAESIPGHGANRQPPNENPSPEKNKRQWNSTHAIDSHTPNDSVNAAAAENR
jgi:hypothetical protein